MGAAAAVKMLLAFASSQAHAKDAPVFSPTVKSIDDFVDIFFERALKIHTVHHADMDDTTLGKPGHLAVSPSKPSSGSHATAALPGRFTPASSSSSRSTAASKRGSEAMPARPLPSGKGHSKSSASDVSTPPEAELGFPPPQKVITRRGAAVGLAGAAVAGALVPAPEATAAEASASAPVLASAGKKLVLPRQGLGAWAWGDSLFWGYDSKKDAELGEVFDYAVSNGVTFFDTAEVYGLGRSETLLGEFAANSPAAADIQVATKFAALPWRTKPGDVLAAAKASADRLGRPIDLYQIHFPNAWANEAYWDGLGEAVAQGLVKAAGVSNYGADALRACHAKLKSRGIPLSSNQIQLSLLYPFALENGLIDTCNELGVQVIAYSPLGLGLLTGKFALPDQLPDGPRRALAEQFLRDPNFSALLDTMRDVGQSKLAGGASPAQVALAWCMAKGACVIPGARTLKQATSNIAAADIKLTAEEVARLDAASAKVKKVLTPDTNPFAKKDVFTGLKMYDS